MRPIGATLTLATALVAASGMEGQDPPPAPKPDAGRQPTEGRAEVRIGEPGSQAEIDAFSLLQTAADPAEKKRLIRQFLELYPNSGMTPLVHREASVLGMQENDFETMVSHGEKALAAIPDDFALMTELARAYCERGMLDKAEEKALSALEITGGAQKPLQVTEEQWEQGLRMLTATNYSTLGYAHARRSQTIKEPEKRRSEALKAVAPFKKAIELNPVDDVSYWRLGLSYILLNDYENAESALARASVLNGISSGYSRRDLEDIYKGRHNNSLEGLEKVIARAKQELGLP